MSATRRQINANPKRLSAPITHCNRLRRRCNNRREFRKPWRGHCEDSLCPPKSFWQKDAANIRTIIVPAKMRAEDYMPARKIKSIRRSHTTYFSEKIYLLSKEDILTFKRIYTSSADEVYLLWKSSISSLERTFYSLSVRGLLCAGMNDCIGGPAGPTSRG